MKWLDKLLFSGLCLFALAYNAHAQTPAPVTTNTADNEDKTVLMRNEASGGLVLHSSGWGVTFRRSKQKTYKSKKYFEVDIVSMKDAKEIRSQNPYYDNSTSFIYGKLNDFIVPRIGIGRQNVLFAKAHTTGVEVRYHYGFGASLGITKPIYLNILVPSGIQTPNGSSQGTEVYNVVVQKYDPINNPNQTPDVIYGNAPFTNGLGDMTLHPGGYVKSGLSFEYAKYPDEVWAIETGVIVDVFPQEIPIMAYIPNKQVFFNFYVSLSYGGKW